MTTLLAAPALARPPARAFDVRAFGATGDGRTIDSVALNNRGTGTSAGTIFKSAKSRGGVVEDVLIRDLVLDSVPTAFSFTLDWNPSSGYATIPKDSTNPPAHWRVLATPVTPPARGLARFRDITIEDVRVRTPAGAAVRIANGVQVDAPAAERQ